MSRSVLSVLRGEATRGCVVRLEAVDCKRLEAPSFFEKTGPTGRLEEAADLFILAMIGQRFFKESSSSLVSQSEEI